MALPEHLLEIFYRKFYRINSPLYCFLSVLICRVHFAEAISYEDVYISTSVKSGDGGGNTNTHHARTRAHTHTHKYIHMYTTRFMQFSSTIFTHRSQESWAIVEDTAAKYCAMGLNSKPRGYKANFPISM